MNKNDSISSLHKVPGKKIFNELQIQMYSNNSSELVYPDYKTYSVEAAPLWPELKLSI